MKCRAISFRLPYKTSVLHDITVDYNRRAKFLLVCNIGFILANYFRFIPTYDTLLLSKTNNHSASRLDSSKLFPAHLFC